jgi:hypothetical protein
MDLKLLERPRTFCPRDDAVAVDEDDALAHGEDPARLFV